MSTTRAGTAAPVPPGQPSGVVAWFTTGSPAPEATDAERRTARWCVALFALVVLFQRWAAPGTPVSLLVPIVVGWSVLAVRAGILEVHPGRLVLWLLAAGATGLVGPAQVLLTRAPLISFGSWALMMLTLAPTVMRLRVRTAPTYGLFLRGVTTVATWFAGLSLLFMVSQVAVPYHDWFATLVPGPLQMPGYVYTYPIAWQSPIYRSNAWIGLEASWTAFIIGVGVITGLLTRTPPWRLVLMLAGMLVTFSGSGFQLVFVGLAAMLLGRRAHLLRRYLWLGLALAVVGATTSVGQSVFGRVTEVGNNRSSTALRATQPFIELWPRWAIDVPTVLLGRGAGSSERLVDDTNITGLLAPTAAKTFMDYGLIAGAVLACYLVAMLWGSHEPALAIAFGAALWSIQTPTAVFVALAFVLVAIWAPSTRPAPFGAPAPTRLPEEPA